MLSNYRCINVDEVDLKTKKRMQVLNARSSQGSNV